MLYFHSEVLPEQILPPRDELYSKAVTSKAIRLLGCLFIRQRREQYSPVFLLHQKRRVVALAKSLKRIQQRDVFALSWDLIEALLSDKFLTFRPRVGLDRLSDYARKQVLQLNPLSLLPIEDFILRAVTVTFQDSREFIAIVIL